MFTNPTLLWWMLSALIVPLLHFARRRPRRVLTPHVFLWERVLRGGQKHQVVRLRSWLSLILQILVIVSVVLLFAEPQFASPLRIPRSTLLVVDVAPSMAATNSDGSTRLSEAVALATRHMDELIADGPVALAVLGDHPFVRAEMGSSVEEFLSVLQELSPEHSAARPADINAMARATEADRVWLVTDRTFAGELDDRVRVLLVGDRHDNVGIVAARLEEADDGSRVTLHVEVSSHGFEEQVTLTASQDDADLKSASYKLSEGANELRLLIHPERGKFVDVRLQVEASGGDALNADDSVSIYWPDAPPFRVLVVAETVDAAFVDGLAALSDVFRMEAADRASLKNWRGAVDGYDLVILNGLREATPLPGANYLLIDTYAPGLSIRAVEQVDDVVFVRRRDSAGILRGVELTDLTARRATRVEIADDVECLIEGSVGPMISSRIGPGVSFVHLSFAVDESNASLVLMDAWPLLLRDILDVMHPDRRRMYGGLARSGGALVPTYFGRALQSARLTSLSDRREWALAPPHPENVFRLPVEAVGKCELSFGDGPGARLEMIGLAVLSREAADLSPRQTDPAPSAIQPLMEDATTHHRDILCALVLFLLLLEWFLYQRGWSR